MRHGPYSRPVTADEDYTNAEAAEREAWEKVKDHLPGTPRHSPELWEKWRARVTELRTLWGGRPRKEPD
jgi:hypothetical protein